MPVLLILIILLLIAVFLPQIWAQRILRRHSKPRQDFPGTGAELARHLLKAAKINQVTVEKTDSGDHYDPLQKVVRLTADNHDGRSLTAIVVAAHEVGHAVQDHIGYEPLRQRTRLVLMSQGVQKLGTILLATIPVIVAITHVPGAGFLMFLGGILLLGTSVVVHLITLPVEWDASFNRALPILKAGNYLSPRDLRIARRILTACALTYVASALATLLNVWQWIRILRH